MSSYVFHLFAVRISFNAVGCKNSWVALLINAVSPFNFGQQWHVGSNRSFQRLVWQEFFIYTRWINFYHSLLFFYYQLLYGKLRCFQLHLIVILSIIVSIYYQCTANHFLVLSSILILLLQRVTLNSPYNQCHDWCLSVSLNFFSYLTFLICDLTQLIMLSDVSPYSFLSLKDLPCGFLCLLHYSFLSLKYLLQDCQTREST